MTLDVPTMNEALLVASAVLLVAILAVRASTSAGLPSLLLYLLIGLGLGEMGLGLAFSDAELVHALGFGALVIILAEGGLTTRWVEIRPMMRLGMSLATIGIVVSGAIVAVFAHYVLGFGWQIAVLLGAITAPTDAAAVFSVLRRVPLPRPLTAALEAESGLNDAAVVVLVTLVSTKPSASIPMMVADVAYELVVGVVVGLAIGFAGAWIMQRVALPASGLYPIAVLSLSVLGYAAAAVIHSSGFAAVYVAALVLGNRELPHRVASRSFAEGLAWLAQIGLFIMLGLMASPSRLNARDVGLAVAVGLALTFVARPVSVLASAVVQPMALRELGFISWAGLRGAVPIVFATVPLSAAVVGADRLFDIVFVLVVLLTLVTAPTLPVVARLLGVACPDESHELDVEAAPLDRVAADMLIVTITPESQMHGVEVGELRLPAGALVTLVVRDGATLVPKARTVLRHGDEMLVVTPRKSRERTEHRLQSISAYGRLAGWLER